MMGELDFLVNRRVRRGAEEEMRRLVADFPIISY